MECSHSHGLVGSRQQLERWPHADAIAKPSPACLSRKCDKHFVCCSIFHPGERARISGDSRRCVCWRKEEGKIPCKAIKLEAGCEKNDRSMILHNCWTQQKSINLLGGSLKRIWILATTSLDRFSLRPQPQALCKTIRHQMVHEVVCG